VVTEGSAAPTRSNPSGYPNLPGANLGDEALKDGGAIA
jgi:hypothetical protein